MLGADTVYKNKNKKLWSWGADATDKHKNFQSWSAKQEKKSPEVKMQQKKINIQKYIISCTHDFKF